MAVHHHRLMQDGLRASAEGFPGKDLLVSEERRVSYKAFLDLSLRLARGLQDRGVLPGDRVAIFLDNGVEAAVSIYAAWLAGGIAMVINPQTKADKFAYLMEDSGCRALIAQESLSRVFRRPLPCPPPALILAGAGPDAGGDTFERITEHTPPAPADPGAIATDLAALIYTSGSTGQPKGVMMTHQNMTFTVDSLIEYLRLDSSDRILNLLPLAFDYGLYQLLMAVRLGATLVLEKGFGYPRVIEQRIQEESITVFPGVPTVFSTFLTHAGRRPLAFPTVRRVTNTAAALSPGLVPSIQRMFPNALIFRMYGLTECKRVCYLEPEALESHPESVGKAIPGTQIFLLKPTGEPAGPGESGILHVRGPHVMAGYWNKPEQSAHMLKPGRHPGERVLCTHDLFRMDGEGYLYFEGRSDDIIKSRGEKVSPVEVENVLHSIPGVRDAAVIGVPDPILGEAIRAYLSLAPGASLDDRHIKRACQAQLESFMVPRDVVFLDDLPKTATGKIRKRDLMDLPFPAQTHPAAPPPAAQPPSEDAP